MFKSDAQIEEIIEVKHADVLAAEPWKGEESAQNRVLIKGGQVVNADQVFTADIYIEDGIIKQVGEHLITPGGARIIEAKGKYVMPGGVDSQTHLTEGAEDFYTGTRAALAGGTTTVLDVVMPRRGDSLLETFKQWSERAEQKACCDFGFHVAVPSCTEKTKLEMQELSTQHGVNSFKLFLAFKDQYQLSDAELLELFSYCKRIGALALVHAENGDSIQEMTRRLKAAGVTGPEGHELSRPEEVEAEATQRACVLAHQVGCPVHVSPLSSRSAAELLCSQRRRGHLASGETTAAALATDGSHQWNRCWRHAAAHVTSPPLRPDPETPAALMALLSSGGLECASSDHRAFTAEQKAAGADDFTRIPAGVNGVQDRMSVLWEKGVASGKMDVCQFVAVTSTNAAKLFNIYPQKGVIAVGSDADVVVWDPQTVHTLSAKTHQQKTDFNVFEGLRCRGAPAAVLARGRLCLDDGQLRVVQGAGRRLQRAAFAPALYRRVQQRDAAGPPRPVNRSGADDEEPDQPTIEVLNGAKKVTETWAGRPSSAEILEDLESDGSEFHLRNQPAEGVRNQQNSGFAASGAQIDDKAPRRTGVRVAAPPGGRSAGSFW